MAEIVREVAVLGTGRTGFGSIKPDSPHKNIIFGAATGTYEGEDVDTQRLKMVKCGFCSRARHDFAHTLSNERPSKLLERIAYGISRIIAFIFGLLAYFTTVRSFIEAKYGSYMAGLSDGVILTLIVIVFAFYVWFVFTRKRWRG